MTAIAQIATVEFVAHEETAYGRVARRVRVSASAHSLILDVARERWSITVESAKRWPSPAGGSHHPVTVLGGIQSVGNALVQRTLEVDCGRTPPTIVFVDRPAAGERCSRRLVISHPDQDRTLDLIERHVDARGLPPLRDRRSGPMEADPVFVP
jgi:hypothetical protein